MKIKNINKKGIASLILAIGIMITPTLSKADIKSYSGQEVTIVDGRKAIIYYTSEDNRSLIQVGEEIGFIDNDYLYPYDYQDDDRYQEVYQYMNPITNNAYLYQAPNNNSKIINTFNPSTEVFVYARTVDGWYIVYSNNQIGFMKEECFIEDKKEMVTVTKITGNNINVRSSASTSSSDNIIGFCDVTDQFEITGYENGFYIINYLGKTGYISDKFVEEISLPKSEFEIKKMVYLKESTLFYSDTNGNYYCYLPKYQNVIVLEEVGNYYKVKVDGVIGYVNKSSTKSLTSTTIVVDVSRQILKVYKKGEEVFRCRVITGKKGMETPLGCYKIGHHMKDYTFQSSGIFNEYWIQFNGNIGIHPANANGGSGWQKESYFKNVVNNAYDNWENGKGRLYPSEHGSHGCVNTMIRDTEVIYSLCGVGDYVLVIEQNDLIKNNLISYNNIDNKVLTKKLI